MTADNYCSRAVDLAVCAVLCPLLSQGGGSSDGGECEQEREGEGVLVRWPDAFDPLARAGLNHEPNPNANLNPNLNPNSNTELEPKSSTKTCLRLTALIGGLAYPLLCVAAGNIQSNPDPDPDRDPDPDLNPNPNSNSNSNPNPKQA